MGPGTESMMPNLFCSLHKWAARQDENFVTEAFAYLLRYLAWKRNPAVVEILALLTDGRLAIPLGTVDQVSVTTQATADSLRPDMEITVPGALLYIEVKVDSPVDPDQLCRYRESLGNRQFDRKFLVLLTRGPAPPLPPEASPDCAIRWIRVSECLDGACMPHLRDDPTGAFLVGQFTSFLASRNISMEHISEHLADGLRSLTALLVMVEEALRACGVEPRAIPTRENQGFNCDHDGQKKKYWVGINFSSPSVLWFQTIDMALDRTAAASLDIGGTVDKKWWDRRSYQWPTGLDLSEENGSFFEVSAPEQFRRIEAFLRASIEKARRIEAAQGTNARGQTPG